MDLKLDDQFVRDYEELRRKVETPPAPPPPPEDSELRREVERLEEVIQVQEGALGLDAGDRDRVERLGQVFREMETRVSQEIARGNAATQKLKTQHAEQLRRLEQSHDDQLAQKERELEDLRTEQARKEREAREMMKAELARKTQVLTAEAQQRIAVEKEKMSRVLNSRLGSMETRVLSQIGGKLARLAYVPLGLRLSSLALDVLFLAIASTLIRFGAEWGRDITGDRFILGMVVAFSLRTFVSPGNLLLGISARRIGPDHRPEGRIGFTSRLLCGLLHYGPLIATAVVAVMDPPTAAGLKQLAGWAIRAGTSGPSLPVLVNQLLRPDSPGLPGVILAISLVWWAVLVLSVLLSSLIHWSTPYFRNTTLVEYLERVGFQRFSPPELKGSEPEVLEGSA